MAMTASVPMMSARGSVRRGSLTSPPTKLRSAQPSNAHRAETSASPKAPTAKLPGGAAGVKLAPPVRGQAEGEGEQDDEQQAAVLGHGRHVLHERTRLGRPR